MNRRSFITKTALATVAAPLLPGALAKVPEPVPVVPVRTGWRCEWRRGVDRFNVIETQSTAEVLQFLNEHPLGVMKMWYNDRLVYDRQSWRVLKEDND